MLVSLCFYALLMVLSSVFFFFFFNDTATTEIYTLSLHDALPICWRFRFRRRPFLGRLRATIPPHHQHRVLRLPEDRFRSEEHTSELQSQSNLVCRLLLEKKKIHMHLIAASTILLCASA